MNQDVQRVNVLGVGISAINMEIALDIIQGWLRARTPQYVTITGVHGVMESQRCEEIRQIHNRAGLVTPDGMPMVWMSHLAGQRHVRRVYGPDLMLALCDLSQQTGFSHYFYGGAAHVPGQLADRLKARYPKLNIAGLYSPPFRPASSEVDEESVEKINAAQPDIVWVGLSTPKQERWMAAHRPYLAAPVLIGVGAAFDFHAGLKPQAPAWMQRSGLEWCFRLATEPRRLAKRYIVNNSEFLWLVMAQLLELHHYPL